MMGYRKDFLIFVCAMLLLSSTVASLSILPRVTRTSDSIIIDFSDVGYAAHYTKSGFIPVPSTNNPTIYNGWSYFYSYPSLITTADAAYLSSKFTIDDELQAFKQSGLKQAPVVQCGRGPTTFPTSRSSLANSERLLGGTETKKNAWPFMVVLRQSSSSDAFFCTGTLISDTKVLLAAQCLERLSLLEMSTVTVLIGMHLKDSTDVQMTRRISKVILHSQFNFATYVNDIAVIVMDSPVPFSRTVGSVCLPAQSADPDQYADQNAVILGWNSAGSTLQQASVSMVANADCRMDPTFGQFVTNTTTCFTSPRTDKFTCTLDIGGPVVINTAPPAPSPAVYTIVGINSYTRNCGLNGLKTRVSAFRDWIDKAN